MIERLKSWRKSELEQYNTLSPKDKQLVDFLIIWTWVFLLIGVFVIFCSNSSSLIMIGFIPIVMCIIVGLYRKKIVKTGRIE